MPLVSKTISNLIGGISQQAAEIRLEGQCENSINGIPSIVEGWKKRKGTKFISKLTGLSDGNVNYHFDEDELITIKDGNIKIYGLDGSVKTVYGDNSDGYLSASDLIFATIADTTFVLNPNKKAAMGAAINTNPYPGRGIIHVKQVNWSTRYNIDNVDTSTVAATTISPDGVDDPNATGDETDADPKWMNFSYIAQVLATQISGATWTKNTIFLPAGNYSVTDSANGQYLIYINGKIAAFSDLPLVAPNGFTVEITNGTSSSSGNYFVKAVTKSGNSFGDCYWEECAKPGLLKTLDASTMPHKILRNSDGTYTYSQVTWDNRVVGDEYSNPEPSFIGKTISDIFYYKNRLGLLAGENVSLSRASEPFAFFMSTVQTLADNEPIDAAGSHHSTVYLKHALPLSEKLYLFGNKAQFVLDEGDSILSPKTASVSTLTEYETDTAISPVSSGKSLFFPAKNESFESLYEGLISDDVFRADSVTSHVPALIPANADILEASPNAEMLVMHSKDDTKTLYLYKSAWSGTDKVQSAWGLLTFKGDVKAAYFDNTTLYIVLLYSDGLYMETLNFDEGNTATEICLDKCLTSTQFAVSNNVITLPYAVSADDLPVLFCANGEIVNITRLSDTTVTPVKTLSSTITAIGYVYDAVLKMSQITFTPSSQKTALTQGRLQLRNFWLNFTNADTFTVQVTPLYRTTQVSRFSGIVGAGESVIGTRFTADGKFSVPVMSRNTQTVIEVHSTSVRQLCLVNGGWEGYYVCRSNIS